jgi:hypothetical protein
MAKYAQGEFTPKNRHKYVGKGSIRYRSSWEMAFMHFLDNHTSVQQWASESIQIPYRNPVTGKQTIYVPDFFILYVDANNQPHGEIVEIKPKKETSMNEAKTLKEKMVVAINIAKWQAANAFCQRHNLKFRIVTENEIFRR